MIVRSLSIVAVLLVLSAAVAGAQTSIDICEAIDTSNSISDDELDLEIQGFKAALNEVLIPAVNAGQSIGIAIVAFSSDVQTFLSLMPINGVNQSQIESAYDDVADTSDRALTNIGGALQRCTDILSNSTADRQAINLSTDGQPTTGPDTVQAADQAKDAGIEVWTLGIGPDADNDLLDQISGCPSTNPDCGARNFQVDTFQDFPDVLREKTGEIANGGNGPGNGDNQPPIANADSARTDVGVAVTIRVLDNDSDPDGDPLTIESVSTPDHGSAVINNNGTITYTPDPGFRGTDRFTYTINDGRGRTASAVVGIGIGVNPPDVDDGNGTAGIPNLTPPWLALLAAVLLALMGRELRLRLRFPNAD